MPIVETRETICPTKDTISGISLSGTRHRPGRRDRESTRSGGCPAGVFVGLLSGTIDHELAIGRIELCMQVRRGRMYT